MIPLLPLLSVAGSAVGKVLRAVPWQAWALAAAVAACWWYGEARADQREAEVRAEYERNAATEADQVAQFLAAETERNRIREQALSDQLQQTAIDHARHLQEAEARAAATVAGIKSGAVQLRQHWQACLRKLPGPGADADATAGADEGADLRAADIGRVQRIAGTCDAEVIQWQKDWQAAVKAVNGAPP